MNSDDVRKLIRDVEQIKEMLVEAKEGKEMEEVELTDWAKEELEEARKTPEEEYVSLENL